MSEGQFRRLHTLVSFEVSRFEKALSVLQASQFPSSVALDYIELLRHRLFDFQNYLKAISDDFPFDAAGAFSRLKSEHRKLVDMFWSLDVLANAQTDEVPWSLIPSIERIAKDLMPERKILTSSVQMLNYQIRWYRNSAEGETQFFVLSLPKIHRANAFLHLLVGHEFFHPLLDEFFVTERPRVLARFRDSCTRMVKDADEELSGLFARHREQRIDQLVESLETAWRTGLEELMCDLGCVAIFGPAAILSASLISSTFEADVSPRQANFYPPWRMRLRTMLHYGLDANDAKKTFGKLSQLLKSATTSKAGEAMTQALQETRSFTESKSDRDLIDQDPLLKMVYSEIDGCLDRAWIYVEDRARNTERWTSSISQIPALIDTLNRAVPPSEIRQSGKQIGDSAALPAIANACWMFQLSNESAESQDDSLVSFERTCRLMLKAFEDVELKRYFDDRQSVEESNGSSL